MMIFVTIILLVLISTIILIGTLFICNKTRDNNSKNIVDFFEPDNLSPELTEMIKFHKENGNVDYNI